MTDMANEHNEQKQDENVDLGLVHTTIPKPSNPSNSSDSSASADETSQTSSSVSSVSTRQLNELREQRNIHEINKAILNIPIEFQVNGTKLQIRGKALRPTEIIDSLIFDLMILYLEDIPTNKPVLERLKLAKERNKKLCDIAADVLFKIVNDDWDKPAITKEWIEQNIPISDPSGLFIQSTEAEAGAKTEMETEAEAKEVKRDNQSLGMQIIQAYRMRCNSNDFFLELFQSRALA